MTMKLNLAQKICTAFFVLITIFWSWIHLSGLTSGFYNYLYSFLFGLVPFFGGILAMNTSRVWGGFMSSMGKAVFFIGLGIFLWGLGENIWSYYNFFLGVAAPYPSLADLGFAPSIFFYGLGIAYLAKVTGAKFGLQNPLAKWLVILAMIGVTILSYYILVVVARGGVIVPAGEPLLKAILDIAYPLGDFIGLSLAVIISGLSFSYLGGRYKFDILALLFGLAVMFVGDSVFSYSTIVNTYYNANFGDLILALGMFLLTFGAIGFTLPGVGDYKSRI